MVSDERSTFAIKRLQAALCILVSVVLAAGLMPTVPTAWAATPDKPTSVMLQIGDDKNEIDVTKNVATLDSQKGSTELIFTVNDAYSNYSSNAKQREFILVDSSGKTVETLSTSSGNGGHFTIDKVKAGHKVVLVTTTRENSASQYAKRYEQQLNVRVVDTKAAETNTPAGQGAIGGISKDGSSWSFSNGLQYTFTNTGFKFLEGTTMKLGAMALPLTYKHNPDGTTIVGINCSPDNVAFYNAVKNGNVWQKYTTDKMADMTKQMDRGFSGRQFGSWGGKAFDWNIMGFMEFNTKDPAAPRAVNLVISTGLKAEGHAQYLIFTGTLTFTIGGKATLTGKLVPTKGIEGKFNLGAYAGLELYIGLGLNYLASVGAYGKGQINIDFNILPDTNLQSIVLSGELGAKAKVFGFTVYTWEILKGSKTLYTRPADTKKMPESGEGSGSAPVSAPNADGTATSPLAVSADTAYPLDSRDYLGAGSALMAAQSSAMTAQEAQSSRTILKGIYGEAEPVCATTNDGPVVVYVADAEQLGDTTRDAANRSVLAYTRLVNGTWTSPRIIDTTSDKHKNFADYSPSVTTDGENLYVAWLAADSKIENGATIGEVGKKLDVNVATIAKGANIAADSITVETVYEESNADGTMPAGPKAVKVGDEMYVGWYTNQTSGSSGEVIGLAGTHAVRLFKRNADGTWAQNASATTSSGAMTSFDVGVYGGKAAAAWSFDDKFTSESAETSLNGTKTIASSVVSTLSAGGSQAVDLAQSATNAQFAKRGGADVLTYALQISPNDGNSTPYLSIQSSSAPGDAGSVVLDGSKVDLPTPYYKVAGDISTKGNVSFLALADGSSDIRALVTTGAGNTDWTAIVEATSEADAVTNYCAAYHPNGTPLFIYLTESQAAASSMNAQADDGGANMVQTTEDSLKHLSVLDVDYDEYAVKAGEVMPITAYVENDGMLEVGGVDLYTLEDGVVTKVASSDAVVPLDEGDDGEDAASDDVFIDFDYTLPAKSAFTKAKEFTVCAVPKGVVPTASAIERAKETESAMTVKLGAASLALSADQQIVDGQESVAATVTNDGIVPHAAKLLFVDGDTGDVLHSVDVPELAEAETFQHAYAAPKGYFQNGGVKSIIVTLENDGTENDGYELNNTEFISTWDVTPTDSGGASTKPAPAAAKAPATGDQIALLLLVMLLLAAAAFATHIVHRARKNAA